MNGRTFSPELTPREITILRDLFRVRLLTGDHLERLHFTGLANPNVRGSARRRTMRRLTVCGFVTRLPRRVGGVRSGSSGLIYSLDTSAYRNRQLWLDNSVELPQRLRRPWSIGWPFVQHTLDVAELYVRLRERERLGELLLVRYLAEPACWHQRLKPDAYAVYETAAWEEHLWLEVDRGTESLPTVRKQLATYVATANDQNIGPSGVFPQVLVTVPSVRRQEQIETVIASLPEPASRFISTQLFDDTFSSCGRAPPTG